MAKIKADKIEVSIQKILSKYGDDVTESMKKVIQKAGSDAKSKVQEKSPVYSGNKKKMKPGTYKKGWTKSTTVNNTRQFVVSIHNKQYSLTHLLQNGHQLRQGGRAEGIDHISDGQETADRYIDQYIKTIADN